jgi:hypothetical protein
MERNIAWKCTKDRGRDNWISIRHAHFSVREDSDSTLVMRVIGVRMNEAMKARIACQCAAE